jgi:hypothetical protein
VLKLETPSIALARRNHGDAAIMELLAQLITNVNEFFNVSRPMNAIQIMETSKLIAKSYYFLKFEEIKLLFENAKLGQYGKIYERLDGSIILEWFEKYDQDRTHAIEVERYNQNKVKNRQPDLIDYEQFKRHLNEMPEKRMKPVNHVRNTASLEQWFDDIQKRWPDMDQDRKNRILKDLEMQNTNGVMNHIIEKLK